jgi:hypothetical protein
LKYQWLIWRKGGDGVLVKQELDFSGSGSFPPLQWGDVVACRIFHPSGSGGASSRNELPPEVLAELRKRIAFPITFEIDGKSREILVRGDRPFFDPTKDEVPLDAEAHGGRVILASAPREGAVFTLIGPKGRIGPIL